MQETHEVMYPVYVIIQVDKENDKIHISPSTAHISISRNEEIVWECLEGTATIAFPGDSPFHAGNAMDKSYRVPRGAAMHAKKVFGPEKQRKDPYRYDVEVVIDGKTYKKDPEVVVDP